MSVVDSTLATKAVPKRKLMSFYKRFANGEQYIHMTPFGTIEEEDKQYWWGDYQVYNHIRVLIDDQAYDLTEEQIYGRNGLVSLLEPYQRQYNSIMNYMMERAKMTTYGYMVVEDGSVDTDELCEEGLMPGKIIVYRQGGRVPEMDRPDFDPFNYTRIADRCLEQMREIAMIYCEARRQGNGCED
jgi:hypothetical protein